MRGINLKRLPFRLVFLYNLYLKIIEGNLLNKIITVESGFAETFKIGNIFIQPDRLTEVKLIAGLLQRPENFMGAGGGAVIGNTGVLQHMIVFKKPCPKTKHIGFPLNTIHVHLYGNGFSGKSQV